MSIYTGTLTVSPTAPLTFVSAQISAEPTYDFSGRYIDVVSAFSVVVTGASVVVSTASPTITEPGFLIIGWR